MAATNQDVMQVTRELVAAMGQLHRDLNGVQTAVGHYVGTIEDVLNVPRGGGIYLRKVDKAMGNFINAYNELREALQSVHV
jgi:hypothetical protein